MKEHEETVLAFIAGYVDTLGFVALFGLFTAHVTGNFVLIGAEVAGVGQGVLLKLLAFPAFIVGVGSASVAAKIMKARGDAYIAAALHLWQALLLFAFFGTGLLALPIDDASSGMVLLCGVLGATAMGVQNARPKVLQKPGLPNTVMTGNVTQIVLDLVDLAHRGSHHAEGPQVLTRLRATLTAMLAFAIGAVGGALAFVHLSFYGLILPIALLLLLAWPPRVARAA
ncbi:YoaK family protein [Caballeronia sp. GAFFF2]|uniref:YoaK family protein n=1 Tax=Caballeronia sp. GAFFF2 TaxID=2921741 RepID=UPI002028D1D9|nr:YoaK family protein [Caballeronia sp. GAFFF2]